MPGILLNLLCIMANFLYEMGLQGIAVAAFIILDWMFVLMNTKTMIPLQARVIEEIAHYTTKEFIFKTSD